MTSKRQRGVVFFAGFALFGWLYFLTFSSLEVNFILKNYLTTSPLLMGLLLYRLWQKRQNLDKD